MVYEQVAYDSSTIFPINPKNEKKDVKKTDKKTGKKTKKDNKK